MKKTKKVRTYKRALVWELSKGELVQLKKDYYCAQKEKLGEGVSYGELLSIDDLVSDEEIYKEYEDCEFVKEDFQW